MRNRIGIILVLALVAGGLAAYLAVTFLKGPGNAPSDQAPATVKVAVASKDLAVGWVLTPEDVKLVSWPAGAVPAGYATSMEEVVGRGLITPVRTNEPLLASKLARKGTGGGLAIAIPEGMRAMSVRVNQVIGVAGFVLPGTHVDVLVTLDKSETGNDARTQVLLQNVQVLSAGQELQQGKDGQDKPKTVPVVTLLVTPDQSEKLTLAATKGQLQLALRNTLDTDTVSTSGARLAALLPYAQRARYRPVRTTRPSRPPSRVNVEVYRGKERSTSTVDTTVTGGGR
ncbi:MAG: Flp pilus assembly protein CpaB [Candidatus Palauibacterales bacterium]|nr:Flp pilus assembly protein CpaB [Candidatus Palauibacterales bacterium]MDP2583643.1 Flp pilus assembly protein CpaB [Candidatus Palauibacterales bacterium]